MTFRRKPSPGASELSDVGAFDAAGLIGIAGLSRQEGVKLRHRALPWGMYVGERGRGLGLGMS